MRTRQPPSSSRRLFAGHHGERPQGVASGCKAMLRLQASVYDATNTVTSSRYEISIYTESSIAAPQRQGPRRGEAGAYF